jgi:hypothetical protein
MFSFDLTDTSATIRTTVFSKVADFQTVYDLVQVTVNNSPADYILVNGILISRVLKL